MHFSSKKRPEKDLAKTVELKLFVKVQFVMRISASNTLNRLIDVLLLSRNWQLFKVTLRLVPSRSRAPAQVLRKKEEEIRRFPEAL